MLSGSPTRLRYRRLSTNSQTFSFHAIAEALQEHVETDEKVVLETVLLNLGDVYSNQHGVFTVPVAGICVFSLSVLKQVVFGDSRVEVSVVKNGRSLASVFAENDNGEDQGSVTAITQLREGDEDWAGVIWPETDAYVLGLRYSSFTGFLLVEF